MGLTRGTTHQQATRFCAVDRGQSRVCGCLCCSGFCLLNWHPLLAREWPVCLSESAATSYRTWTFLSDPICPNKRLPRSDFKMQVCPGLIDLFKWKQSRPFRPWCSNFRVHPTYLLQRGACSLIKCRCPGLVPGFWFWWKWSLVPILRNSLRSIV